MANRHQRRKARTLQRQGQAVDVREDGEVQLGVGARDGFVEMTLAGPDGQTMVLGVPPDAARKFALALDGAADAVEREQPAPARSQHHPNCFQSCPAETCESCAAIEREMMGSGED
jgi:hypothetical protein